jgi:SAM-dependent methyltransferase
MAIPYQDYFSDKSELYASARPVYPAALFEFLHGLCRESTRCWDCATGTGQAAQSLAGIFQHVEATDVVAEPIAQGTPHPRISFSVQPAEQTSFAPHSFDLVTVAQALHWFDYERFWPEVKRVLKLGGVFAAWGYSWPNISMAIDSVIQGKLRDEIETFWAPQNRILWDGYRNVDFPFAAISTPTFELAPQWNLHQLLAYFGTWSATRRCMESRGEGFFEDFALALERVWGNPHTVRAVNMEFHLKVGRKTA